MNFSDDSLDDEILLQEDGPVNNPSHTSPVWEPPASGAEPVYEPPASGQEPTPSPTSNLFTGDLVFEFCPGERKGETVHSQLAQPGAG